MPEHWLGKKVAVNAFSYHFGILTELTDFGIVIDNVIFIPYAAIKRVVLESSE